MLCLDCLGKGTRSIAADIADCLQCDVAREHIGNFCHEHICSMCDGKGVVCPTCRGMRFGNEETRHGTTLVRCPFCTSGNNIDDQAEMRVIRRYLDKYPGLTDDELLEQEREVSAAVLAQGHAYWLDWKRRTRSRTGGREQSPFEQRMHVLRETYGDPVDDFDPKEVQS